MSCHIKASRPLQPSPAEINTLSDKGISISSFSPSWSLPCAVLEERSPQSQGLRERAKSTKMAKGCCQRAEAIRGDAMCC